MPYSRVQNPEKLRRMLAAVLKITADEQLPELLRHFVDETCSLVGARYGALGVLDESRNGLERFLTFGLSDEEQKAIGPRPTGRGVLGRLISDPVPLRLDSVADHPDSVGFPDHHPLMTSFLGVPLRVRDQVYGNLYLTEKIGADAFSEEDEAVAEFLALAAGIAIENSRLRDSLRELSLLDNRDRVARDLHDSVIQRIFAVGMTLQSATHLTDLDQVTDRVGKAVDDLDTTITEIRTAIFELGDTAGPGGLRRAILRLVNELTPSLGSRPEVRFVGPVDTAVPRDLTDHVLSVVQEALSVASTHIGVTSYAVAVEVGDGLVLKVTDNGRGCPHTTIEDEELDVASLRTRAEHLGGLVEVAASDEGGTELIWSVPL